MRMGGWGKRREPGVRNKLEAEYEARLLADPLIEWCAFERFKWKLADNTFWTPDYLVQTRDGELVIHEVKGGFFPEHNRLKLKIAAEQIPMRFILAQYKN